MSPSSAESRISVSISIGRRGSSRVDSAHQHVERGAIAGVDHRQQRHRRRHRRHRPPRPSARSIRSSRARRSSRKRLRQEIAAEIDHLARFRAAPRRARRRSSAAIAANKPRKSAWISGSITRPDVAAGGRQRSVEIEDAQSRATVDLRGDRAGSGQIAGDPSEWSPSGRLHRFMSADSMLRS